MATSGRGNGTVIPLTAARSATQAGARALASDELYAALDLGTNSCRMLIATPEAEAFRVVDAYSKSVRLGIDLERTGALSRRAINRTIIALRTCAEKLAAFDVGHVKLVATEACRRASNGTIFLDEVRRETGLELDVIRPSEEARLAVISCASLVGQDSEQVLIVDIGGGSTELVWIDLTDVAPHLRASEVMKIKPSRSTPDQGRPGRARVVDWISVPTGVATLFEKYRDVDEDGARFALMSWYFEEQISAFGPYSDEAFLGEIDGFQVIGTSGTVTTVGAAHLGLQRYDRSKVDGMQMRADEVNAVVSHFLQLGPEGRRTHPGIGRDRTRLIMAGAAIFQTLLRVWPTDCVRVADRGLREGLLYSMMSETGALSTE